MSYKGDAGNDPELLAKYVLEESLDFGKRVLKDSSLSSDEICGCGHFWVDHNTSQLDSDGDITCNLCGLLCVHHSEDMF